MHSSLLCVRVRKEIAEASGRHSLYTILVLNTADSIIFSLTHNSGLSFNNGGI